MFSKKTMRVICIVVAAAMLVPICLGVLAMFNVI